MKKILILLIILVVMTSCGSSNSDYINENVLELEEVGKNENITIPDVSGLTVYEAEKILTNLGFDVSSETKKENSNTYEKGTVIGTNPAIGRSRPKGIRITIIESLGHNSKYIIENYVGKNYVEVQTILEKEYKMNVTIKKKKVELFENADVIIEQSLTPGTEITVSENNPANITLYVPNVYDNYPDFVEEGWSIKEIKEFAEKYSLQVVIKEEESEYPSGTVIKQSRTGKIINGATLIIYVAK